MGDMCARACMASEGVARAAAGAAGTGGMRECEEGGCAPPPPHLDGALDGSHHLLHVVANVLLARTLRHVGTPAQVRVRAHRCVCVRWAGQGRCIVSHARGAWARQRVPASSGFTSNCMQW